MNKFLYLYGQKQENNDTLDNMLDKMMSKNNQYMIKILKLKINIHKIMY